ncbi:TPA: GNAT family acetyltransferase [Pseudomonas aeruginosa]|nr:GNAT family acetyltransferase [Pseudomonas aeruginosa]
MTSDVQVLVRRGPDIAEWFDAVAGLRASVFRSFPYLYEGDTEYEKHYLAMYARSADSLLVLALADDVVVGASTGLPLGDAEPAFHVPFADQGIPVEAVFYCGESVLLPAFRGLGLGHRFFDEREAHARSLGGMQWASFASVDRADDDLRRPSNYRSNDPFWTRRGYVRQSDMKVTLPWKQVGEPSETEQTLTMWLHSLENAK